MKPSKEEVTRAIEREIRQNKRLYELLKYDRREYNPIHESKNNR